MDTEKYEGAAICLIGGMAAGVMGGGLVFPQIGLALGDTLAGLVLAVAGTAIAGIALELVAGLRRPR